MASKGFEGGPSCGQSFEAMSNGVTAHNEMLEGWPAFGASMAGGNGVTDKAYDAANMPGSNSEQTMSDHTPWAASSHDTPNLEESKTPSNSSVTGNRVKG